jgi:hypothetical protein
MRIDIAYPTEKDQQQATGEHSANESSELRVLQIEPDDAFESVLMALRLQSEPVLLLLPEEQSHAFSDPSHFAQLREVCTPKQVRFLIPQARIETLAPYAHSYGFAFASSQEKASQFLIAHEKEQMGDFQKAPDLNGEHRTGASSNAQGSILVNEQDLDRREGYTQQTVSTEWPPEPAAPLQESPYSVPTRSPRKYSTRQQRGLIAALVALLIVAGAVLLPALFSAQPELMGTMQPVARVAPAAIATSVGQIAFTSSGQLDPTSSKGLNDTITVSLHNLTMPARGQSFYAWLMPDKTDDTTIPLLLGKLSITRGTSQLTYVHPDHENLLAVYSGFEVAEQPSNPVPETPPLDPKEWRYVGSIPNVPTPGDEQQYSLLSHMRHLLAKDPTLQEIGLQGGLDIWLYRNAEDILEWSNAARDNWAGGQQTALMHRHMIRVLDYLDGAAYASTSGDLPPGSPLLVDPHMGRIGLLEVSPTQVLPAYLTHIDIHLQGLINAPGHSQAQRQLAIKIDTALKTDTSLLQNVRNDAVKLVRMRSTQLKSNTALFLLNDMVTNANAAYTGQFDPTIGGDIDGIVWIHNELQGIATIPVTVAPANNP